ncbi:MAG: hypothetical protein WBP79_04390 [Candidatus Acidiferrales bacterium]
MSRRFYGFVLLLIPTVILGSALSVFAQEKASSAETVPITTVVTVLGPKFTPPPAIGKEDVIVHEAKNRLNVTGWIPAQGDKAGLELAIVIDDSSSTDLGLQLSDLTTFIKSQPKTAGIGLFYASNGTVQAASQFNTDHEAVAKSLRLPFGVGGGISSVYLSVMDLMSRWPATGMRREILLIADGIDRFRGDIPTSTDVQSTMDRAQKAGIMIHTLYVTGVGRASRNMFRINLGQSNLSRIADATGGEAFFQGTQTPISFGPYLQQLEMVLKNQFLLTFSIPRSKKPKGELRPIRVRTEQHNVEISAAEKVFVRGPAR